MIKKYEFCYYLEKMQTVRKFSDLLSSELKLPESSSFNYLIPGMCEIVAIAMDLDKNVYGRIIADYVLGREYKVMINKRMVNIQSNKHFYDLLLKMKCEDEKNA